MLLQKLTMDGALLMDCGLALIVVVVSMVLDLWFVGKFVPRFTLHASVMLQRTCLRTDCDEVSKPVSAYTKHLNPCEGLQRTRE